jgi:hypothetical protein
MVPNSEYEDWLVADQQVFSFLLASVSKEILVLGPYVLLWQKRQLKRGQIWQISLPLKQELTLSARAWRLQTLTKEVCR